MENHNTITPDMQLHIEDVLKEQLPQFSKEVTDEGIIQECMQCGNKTYKELHCRECGNNFPHDSYFKGMRDGLIKGEGKKEDVYYCIESTLNNQPVWWTGKVPHIWETDIHKANKYKVPIDASNDNQRYKLNGTITEHMDM